MIVDLMRNDLGRVCEYGSVEVPALTELREAPGVWHLVSTVTGTLRRDVEDAAAPARHVPAGLGHRRAQDPRHARDRRARGERTRGLHRGDRLRQPGCGAGAERGDPHARDERRANLARRGRRRRGRLRSARRAGGVPGEGAARGKGGGRRAREGGWAAHVGAPASHSPARRTGPTRHAGILSTMLVRDGMPIDLVRAPRPARAQRGGALRRAPARPCSRRGSSTRPPPGRSRGCGCWWARPRAAGSSTSRSTPSRSIANLAPSR